MGDPKSDDWLPEGWRVEVKVRHNGKKDKFYFPPSGGCRFNSKIEVSRYLNGSHPHSEQKARSNDRGHSNEVVIEKTVPEGLPLGWTKEIKVTKKGGRIRRDPLYTDPVSGYVLRSMKNACRYIESGVGGRLAFKRNNKENHDVELEDDKTFSPAVAEKEGSEVHEKQNAVIGDQSLKPCEIAKDDQILTSVSTGECVTGSEHTSDQFMSVAKRQNVEVNRIPGPIVSDQSLKSFEIAKDEQTLNSASAGECTTVSDHASDQCVSIAKQQKLEVDGTSSQIVSDQTLKSCEIAKDEQVLDSASTGECTAISKHTSDQFVSVIKKQKLAVNTTPSSIISDQSLKSCGIVKDEQILNSASAGECTILSKHTSGGVGTESSSSEFLEDKGSNQTEEKSDSVKAEDPLQAVLQDKPSVEVGETKKESKKTGVGKSRKKTDLNLPRRASKRLAGIPLAPTPELKAATRARRAALEPSNEIIASTSEQASCGDPDTELNTKHAFDTSKSTEIPVDSNESKHAIVDLEHAGKAGSRKQGDKKHQYDVASPPGNLANGEHAGKIETYSTGDEKQGLPFDLPLEELWQDPCIAFAIKTLTGTSVDDSDSIKESEEAGQMLVVYDDPSDQRSLSLDDTSSAEESPDETRLSLETPNDAIPYIGQRFSTHDEGYEFYSEFAKRCGFSIRRHRTEGKDGVGKGLTRRYFVCHRAGNTPVKTSNENKPQRNRKSSRCGCQAYMRISKVTELGAPEWRVTGFDNHHNHELLEPNQVRFLPAYRTISDTDKSRILMFAKTGISVQQMMRLMELEKCVEPGYLPFTEKDVRNLLQSFRKLDPEDESVDLLRMCRNIKEKDPNFKFEYTLDSDNRLENIAWSYASSVQSYEIFGDAVVFDTTHRLTAFDLPLGIWVGMNNYGMPCFFGCVISREENLRSLSWALKAFLGFMNGKAPQTILTDQNMCLKDAIAKEMPSTKHALCIWMIVAKFPSWFNAVLGERYNEWKAEFYRLYNLESIEDFEQGWRNMVNIFGLHTNRHVANLHALRNLWALPYLRSHFFAGMTAAGHSKSINAFIQRFLSAQTRLAHFVEQVAVAVDFKDQAAEQQTMQQNLQNISLKTGAPMESHAATVLTPYAFSKLQEQLVLAAHYASYQMEDGFHVRHHTKLEGGRKVYWVPREEIISCSCNQFEFSGILCRHALRVLSTGNCFQIPERYLPLRWRRINTSSAKLLHSSNDHGERIQLLQNMVSSLITESAKSKERLDIATEQVSILLSRIRDQPVPSQGIRDFTSIHRKL